MRNLHFTPFECYVSKNAFEGMIFHNEILELDEHAIEIW